MPKRYGNYRGRKAYSRYQRRRTLSNQSIYTRISARAQSRQIVALKNRVNAISRSLRPETLIWNFNSVSDTFSNDSTATTYKMYQVSPVPSATDFVGTDVHLLSLNLNFSIEYSDNYQKVAAEDHQRTCSIRFILLQMKSGRSDEPFISEVLDHSGVGPGYELNTVKPLRDGVTSNFDVVSDWRYAISNERPIILRRLFFRRLKNIRWEPTSDFTYPAGTLILFVVTSGLHWDSTYNQQIKLSLGAKIAYNDN